MQKIFARINQYLFFTVLSVVILFYGRQFLIPVVFAALLAMLMAPVCRRIDRMGAKRAISCLACTLILLAVLGFVGFVIGKQFSAFADDVTLIEKKGKEMISRAQSYVQEQLGVSREKQEKVVKDNAKDAGQKAGSIAAKVIAGISATIASIIITLVFTFLLLYNKERYQKFFLRVFRDRDPDEVKRVTDKISEVSQQYLTGRAMSIIIIAVLYSIGLSIIGLKNAVLLAGIAALLTLVPYLGTVLGGLFPVMMALVTEDSNQMAINAALVMFVIQTMDNYFIEPNVVGGEVNLNALTSIISIMAGGMIWGVAGMILFLPMTAIVKIVCDHVEVLQPIGYILGEEKQKKPNRVKEWLSEKFRKITNKGRRRN